MTNAKSFACGAVLGLLAGVVLSTLAGAVLYVLYLGDRQDDLAEAAYATGAFCPVEGDESVTSLLLPIR